MGEAGIKAIIIHVMPCGKLRKKIFAAGISGSIEIYYGFVRPDCGCFAEIDAKKLPSNVKSKARPYCSPWQADIYD